MSLEKFKLFFNSTIGTDDEVKAFLATNGGGLLTSTTNGDKESLDVHIAGSDISITTSESDVYAEDSAHASGDQGTFTLGIRVDDLDAVPASVLAGTEGDYQGFILGANGALKVSDREVLAQLQSGVVVSDGGGSLTVDGTVAATQSGSWLVSVDDNGGSLTVDAVDLDIRDLTHVSDSVKIGDGTDFLAVNADGSLNITDNGGSLTVDATDLDIRDLTAASDSVASWTNDGAGNPIDSQNGALKVADCVAFGSVSAPGLGTANTAATVTAVANQEIVEVQNLSNFDLYYGPVGTTTVANGLLIPKKSIREVKICGNFDLISASIIPAGEVRIGHFISA